MCPGQEGMEGSSVQHHLQKHWRDNTRAAIASDHDNMSSSKL
jgi:hypothetical protein